MNDILKRLVFVIALISAMVFIPGCEEEVDSYSYSFQIVADGDFEGYYIIDDDPYIDLNGEQETGKTRYSVYKNMETANSIIISATGTTTATSSIQIYVFKDDIIVKSVSASQTDSTVKVTAYLTYTFADDSEE